MSQRKIVIRAAALLLAGGIFLFDTISPLDIAVASLHVIVVSIAATYLDRPSVWSAGIGCIVLTVVSLLLQHGPDFADNAALRAAISLLAIGMTSFLALTSLAARDRLGTSQRQRANLARFVAPQHVDELAEIDAPLSLTRHQAAAVLFVDIIGFTAYSEELAPEDVIALLRELLALFGDCVFANRGVVDKYMGDGLLAVFGLPQPDAVDATNAARCAIDILRSVGIWNERRRPDRQPIRVAIGIDHGWVVQGDVGSENRLELTVVGHTVNMASRVERHCRPLKANLLVTASFVEALRAEGGHALADILADRGYHRLRGHTEPIRLYGTAWPSDG